MTRLRWAALTLGLLGAVVALAAARSSLAGGLADSPEARLRARIADLHVEVAVLDVECAAARENLLEGLKQVGRIEFADRPTALAAIKGELEQVFMEGHGFGADGAWRIRGRIVSEVEMAGSGDDKQLLADFLKHKRDGEQERALLAGVVLNARLQTSRAQADRMKADYQKKVRSFYQKKRELDEAEAEYRATK